MLFSKKGMIMSWADLMKGLIIGLILGLVLAFLMAKGILPMGSGIFCPAA
ncbi:MAG: hypothetical protein ACLFNM_00960 [Candidatus Woesearchaeota archaeon]